MGEKLRANREGTGGGGFPIALEKMLGDSAGCFGFGKGASTEEDLSERVNAAGKT